MPPYEDGILRPNAGWPLVRLDEVASRGSGHTPSKRRPEYWNGDVFWISLADTPKLDKGPVQASEKTISLDGVAHSSAVIHPAGTVILLRGSSVGKSAVLASDMAVSQDYVTWTCSSRVDNWYLYYNLQARKSEFSRVAFGNTIKTIGLDYFRNFEVQLPPISEQRAIASTLRDTDQLILTLDRVIAKRQAVKQGLMQQLLTGRTRLPGFDSPWVDIRLGKHVVYLRTAPLPRAQLDSESSLQYLHYGDIHTCLEPVLAAATEPMPRVARQLARNAGFLQVGDLVFADASEDSDGVGKSVEIISVPVGGVISGLHTIAARFDKNILADGFKAYLQFVPAFRQSLIRLAVGTKVLATTRTYISSVTLTLPSLDEQRAIAQALTDCETEISHLYIRLAKARSIKLGMMQQLLTGRTRLPTGSVS